MSAGTAGAAVCAGLSYPPSPGLGCSCAGFCACALCLGRKSHFTCCHLLKEKELQVLGPPAHPAGQTHTEAPAGSRPRRGLTLPDLHFPAEAEAEHRSHTDPSGQETSDLLFFNPTQQNLAQLWPREALLEPQHCDGHRGRDRAHTRCAWHRSSGTGPGHCFGCLGTIRAALQPPCSPSVPALPRPASCTEPWGRGIPSLLSCQSPCMARAA